MLLQLNIALFLLFEERVAAPKLYIVCQKCVFSEERLRREGGEWMMGVLAFRLLSKTSSRKFIRVGTAKNV